MSTPQAVLISDVHFSLSTLPLASASLRQAISHATALHKPLIIAGDLHDTKGAMRGECVSAMLKIFQEARCQIYILVGNHDRINEKDKPHALEFLGHLTNIVQSPINIHGLWLIPYESDPEVLKEIIKPISANSTLIMHTGVQTAKMGHYTKDTSSLPPHLYHGLRVVSGHYHCRQDIELPGGLFSYIGNPYTLNYGEALDPPKGFQVLNTDGSLTFIPTNLRKHIVEERTPQTVLDPLPQYNPGDLVKIKVSGPKSELDKLDRHEIGMKLLGHTDYKLDLNPDKNTATPQSASSTPDTFDTIIEATPETDERKQELKALWRSLYDGP